MDISTALARHIRHLTTSIDEEPWVIENALHSLRRDLRRAVWSYLGLELTLFTAQYPFSLSAFEDHASPPQVATSLRLDLHELTGAEPPSRICLYAAVPGAFVDLAADIRHALRLTDGSIGLDETKTPTSLTSGLNGLAELSAINQAIGILIGRGHPPGHAHRELSRQADGAGVSLHVRARQLIYETSSILRSSALPDDPPDGQRN